MGSYPRGGTKRIILSFQITLYSKRYLAPLQIIYYALEIGLSIIKLLYFNCTRLLSPENFYNIVLGPFLRIRSIFLKAFPDINKPGGENSVSKTDATYPFGWWQKALCLSFSLFLLSSLSLLFLKTFALLGYQFLFLFSFEFALHLFQFLCIKIRLIFS